MKLIFSLLLWLLSGHSLAFASIAPAGSLLAVQEIYDYFEEEGYVSEDFELDSQGESSIAQLEKSAKNVAEYERKYAPFYSDTPDSDFMGFEESDGCFDDNVPVFLAKSSRGKRRKGVSRCVPREGVILNGCCLMYIRERIGLPPNALSDLARSAGSGLRANGYCNQIGKYNAYTAPVGAVLIYRGGGAGHAEYRDSNGYYFGPTNAEPASSWKRKRRTLTGVWVRCS